MSMERSCTVKQGNGLRHGIDGRVRHGVYAAFVPRMALQQTNGAQDRPACGTVHADAFHRVARTTWMESAMLSHVRAENGAVESDHRDQCGAEECADVLIQRLACSSSMRFSSRLHTRL